MSPKIYFFHIHGASAKSSFSKMDEPVTFLLYDVDIQIILESKRVFENIIQYVLKIIKGFFFWDMLYSYTLYILHSHNANSNTIIYRLQIIQWFAPDIFTTKHLLIFLPALYVSLFP